MGARRGPLIALGEGVYTVPEIARILQPSMSEYKVRRWLDKGLLGEPIRWGTIGRRHLLTFQQLLKARTIQELRERGIPLQRITPAVEKLSLGIFGRLFSEEWHELRFFATQAGRLGVMDDRGEEVVAVEIETGQHIMPETLSELTEHLRRTRDDWERGEVDIAEHSKLVSNARVVAGSPTIKGTRIETAFIARVARRLGVAETLERYTYLDREAVEQAAHFEDISLVA